MILSAAKAGDKACAAIVEQAANHLGLGLANLVNLFNPSVLVLDQRPSACRARFVRPGDQSCETAGTELLDQRHEDCFWKTEQGGQRPGSWIHSTRKTFQNPRSQTPAVYDRIPFHTIPPQNASRRFAGRI